MSYNKLHEIIAQSDILPINYQSNYRICYHSDCQFGSLTFIDSPIDYFLGQLCPIFCVCKSTSYESKWLKYKYLKEYKGSKNFCNVLLRFANFGGLVINDSLPKSFHSLPIRGPPQICIPSDGIRIQFLFGNYITFTSHFQAILYHLNTKLH